MSYNNYPTFEGTDRGDLRTWNRCATVYNIREDKGEEEALKYIEQFPQKDKNAMYVMMQYIALKGYENVLREISRGDHDPAKRGK